jgi:hypothetical protein
LRVFWVSKFEPFATDFRLRTCGTACRPQDVRHAQLAVANHLKFENLPVLFVLSALFKNHLLFLWGNSATNDTTNTRRAQLAA